MGSGFQGYVTSGAVIDPVGSLEIDGVMGNAGSLRCGANGHAFSTDSNQVYIFRTPLVAP